MSVNADAREPSDADLITAVAAGDEDAYGLLWQRHSAAATRFAATLTRPGNVDDLVSEGFLRVLRAIKAGGGPDGAFRSYLFNTIRRFNIDTGRAYGQRVTLTGETETLDVPPADSAGDTYAMQAEHETAWQAWQSLPEDSRTLLWHLIIEEETPAQIAPLLGVSANGVASRAVRARERLRQAFLVQHLARADDECRQARAKLGGYVRNALSTRDRTAVEEHLHRCERCSAALPEITDVNHSMRAIIAPLLLGGSVIAAHYFASAPHAAAAAPAARPRVSRTTVKIGAALGIAACAAGVLTYIFSASDSSPVADQRPPLVGSTVPSTTAAPRVPVGPTAPATNAPSSSASSPATPTSPRPSTSAQPAAPPSTSVPSHMPAGGGRPAARPTAHAHAPARHVEVPVPPPAVRGSSSAPAPSSSAPASSTPTASATPSGPATPTAAPAQTTVSIPLPGGPATVTATASPGWTITGWRADNAGVTGGATDAQHATWSVSDGSMLVVSAAGWTAPPAILSVQITPAGGTAQTFSYALN